MKILILSSRYPPDIGTAGFRAKIYADALLKYGDEKLNIDVLIPSDIAQAIETNSRLTVLRIKTPPNKRSFLYRLYIFFYFAINALITVRSKQYDMIIVTSGRLGSAVLGAVIADIKSAILYLDLRESAPDNIKDIFKGWQGSLLRKIFSSLEGWAVHKAKTINLISPAFLAEYQNNYPNCTFTCYTHAVNPLFMNLNMPAYDQIMPKRLKIYYAGTIGYAQQLHLILPELAQRTAHTLDFYVIGNGNNVALLRNALIKNKIHNVTLLPEIPRAELIPHYQNADILFLHIYPYPFTAKVLPSKLFEYAAIGKPIWAGIMGFAQQFVEKEISNCAIFKPGDVDDALLALSKLSLKSIPRTEFNEKFNQESLMKNLAHEILSLDYAENKSS